jgi:mono/diheme cytochrome c family protein
MGLLPLSTLVILLTGADVPPANVTAITDGYRGTVQQVFGAHCADCHGKAPDDLPAGAKTTAQKKSKRAHKKFGMDEGFPFTSKWPLPKLLAEIRDEVEDEDMPPAKYMKQKGRVISAEERRAIADWAKSAETTLKNR